MPIHLKNFQKIAEEGTLPNSFYAATITLIPKRNKDNTKQENYRLISLMSIDAKILKKKKNVSKQFSNISKHSHTMIKLDLFQGVRVLQYTQINVIHHINKLKGKNHMIIWIDAEKAFDKTQHPFMTAGAAAKSLQ